MAPATLPFTELERWAIEAQDRGIQTDFRRQCMPLVQFPERHLERIRAEVEDDEKPEQWLRFEFGQIVSRSWYEWHWQRGIDPDARRPAIPKSVREIVMERDGLVCQLCGGDVEPGDVHLDHIKPWSKGGLHTVANLQVTHSLCNMRKAARYEVAD